MTTNAPGHDLSKYWIIIRMAASRTEPVTLALQRAGYDAWTPMETSVRHAPRTRVVKSRKLVPSMPTYAFVRANRAFDLAIETADPQTSLPDFTIFRDGLRAALVADRELDPVRVTEQQGQRRKDKPLWQPGDLVRVPEGPCAGMSGIVESTKSKGKMALIAFPGWQMPIEISAFILLPDSVNKDRIAAPLGAARRQDRLAEAG